MEGTCFDKRGELHSYTVNIRFARGTEDYGCYYYRCYIYKDGNYNDKQALFFGAVNAKGGRAGCAQKAALIFGSYMLEANLQKDIKKGSKYIESIMHNFAQEGNVASQTKHKFTIELYGDIVFQYSSGKGLIPVTSTLKGTLSYQFTHGQQIVVWVIPVYMEIGVTLKGELLLNLRYDTGKLVTIEEAKATISAELYAKVGIRIPVVSVGINGTIGTVFVLEFYPEAGIESWKINGKLSAYAQYYTIKWKKSKWGFKYPSLEPDTKEVVIYSKDAYIIDNRDASEKSLMFASFAPLPFPKQ